MTYFNIKNLQGMICEYKLNYKNFNWFKLI
jgi:hypothetical protein